MITKQIDIARLQDPVQAQDILNSSMICKVICEVVVDGNSVATLTPFTDEERKAHEEKFGVID